LCERGFCFCCVDASSHRACPAAPSMTYWGSQLVLASLLASSLAAQSPTSAEAIALEQQGKLSEAAQAWKSITAGNPRDAAAFARLGIVLSKEQRYPEAASAYKRALALNAKLPGIQLNLGLAEFKQGHFSASGTAFRAAVAADP